MDWYRVMIKAVCILVCLCIVDLVNRDTTMADLEKSKALQKSFREWFEVVDMAFSRILKRKEEEITKTDEGFGDILIDEQDFNCDRYAE